MNNKNTTLLIAGIFSYNGLKMVDVYCNLFQEIIVSTYQDKNNKYLSCLKDKYSDLSNITILENFFPDIKNIDNSQNIYMQCFSVSKGLEKVSTKFVIKTRSDEFYSYFDKLESEMPSDKISSCNIFIRDVSYKYFHLSDHVIYGEANVLLSGFSNLMKLDLKPRNTALKLLDRVRYKLKRVLSE